MAVMDWLGSITNSLLGAPEEKKETGFSSTGLGGLFYDDKGKFDPRKIGGIVGAIGGGLGLMDDKSPPQGYQGSIPNRRPGSMGRRYFSDVQYQSPDAINTAPAVAQAAGLASVDPMVRQQAARPDLYPAPQAMAAGGILSLKEGKYLAGASDGMADQVPATVDNVEPAALSDGEYVIPADVVSHLGNGNSDAGAKVLDKFLLRVRKERTGNDKQGKQIDPNKLLPA